MMVRKPVRSPTKVGRIDDDDGDGDGMGNDDDLSLCE